MWSWNTHWISVQLICTHMHTRCLIHRAIQCSQSTHWFGFAKWEETGKFRGNPLMQSSTQRETWAQNLTRDCGNVRRQNYHASGSKNNNNNNNFLNKHTVKEQQKELQKKGVFKNNPHKDVLWRAFKVLSCIKYISLHDLSISWCHNKLNYNLGRIFPLCEHNKPNISIFKNLW